MQALVQRAYRGEASRAGWTHEADLLDDERVSVEELRALATSATECLLVAVEAEVPVGCVRVADQGKGVAYLGMLSVEPVRQAGGIARRLIAAAEEVARTAFAARTMEMMVIDVRHELIAYYQRRGYAVTGSCAFPYPTPRALSMAVLSKPLVTGQQG